MNRPGGEVRQRADTSGALLSLLAHDLREPLGPIELALSMIIEASSPDTAEIAGYAEANCRRMQRLIDAVLWAMRPPGALEREPADLAQIASAAAEIARVLGTACSVVAESCDVDVVPAAMRDAIASLLDCIPDRVTAVL
ncbi:MAG: HAMP domain-containing histidine kinase, partial [Actinobacteria bacterium]